MIIDGIIKSTTLSSLLSLFSPRSLVLLLFFLDSSNLISFSCFNSAASCFRCIMKSCFKWNSTIKCSKGSSEVGASNQCYLEYLLVIDQYKETCAAKTPVTCHATRNTDLGIFPRFCPMPMSPFFDFLLTSSFMSHNILIMPKQIYITITGIEDSNCIF